MTPQRGAWRRRRAPPQWRAAAPPRRIPPFALSPRFRIPPLALFPMFLGSCFRVARDVCCQPRACNGAENAANPEKKPIPEKSAHQRGGVRRSADFSKIGGFPGFGGVLCAVASTRYAASYLCTSNLWGWKLWGRGRACRCRAPTIYLLFFSRGG